MTLAEIQIALNATGFGPVATDGVLGPMTREAIKRFQRANNLMPDGIPGPRTQQVLASKLPAPSDPVAPSQGGQLITAAIIRKVAPGARADLIAAIVGGAAEIAAAGIVTPLIASHFLSEVCTETGGLKAIEENLNYSAQRLTQVWPARFPTLASAKPFANNPPALANKVYGGRLGNVNPNDGWTYRGGGMLQTTGRFNYARAGYEKNPQALREPVTALTAALTFWKQNNLSAIARTDDVVKVRKAINGGTNGIEETKAYLAKAKKEYGI